MVTSRWGFLAALLVGVAAQGCSYLGSARDFDPEDLRTQPGWIAVSKVSPKRQAGREECGIAAMEMVLAHYDRAVPPGEVEKACPVQPGAGSRAGEMRDFARSKGLQAYLFHGDVADFQNELARDHPVIVGLVKQYSSGPFTHFEVAVAVHPERREIVTLDPAHGWRSNSLDGFLQEWDAAARLTLVIYPARTGSPTSR